MNSSTAVSTVFYPACITFLADFFASLVNQTVQNFTLVAFNDGFADLEDLLDKSGLPSFRIINVHGSPAEIRGTAVSYLESSTFDNIVFLDPDDYPSNNRIEDALKNLANFSITFCDLSLVNAESRLLKDRVWAERLIHNPYVAKENLQRYNVLGLGNTAVKRSKLRSINLTKEVPIPDWHIFYSLIDEDKAIFSSESVIYYRQHADNWAGMGAISKEKLQYIFHAKKAHYLHLIDNHPELLVCYSDLLYLITKYQSDDGLADAYIQLTDPNKNLFWWEETEILER